MAGFWVGLGWYGLVWRGVGFGGVGSWRGTVWAALRCCALFWLYNMHNLEPVSVPLGMTI